MLALRFRRTPQFDRLVAAAHAAGVQRLQQRAGIAESDFALATAP
jgi:hypothetical protein